MQNMTYAKNGIAETKQGWHLQDMQRVFFFIPGPRDSGIQPFLHVIHSKEVS